MKPHSPRSKRRKQKQKFLLYFLLLIIFPFFFLGGPGYYGSRSFIAVWNLGHIFFFLILTIILSRLFCSQVTSRSLLFYTFLTFSIVLGVGVGIELLQSGFDNRSSLSLSDVLRNQLGWFAGTTFFCLRIQEQTPGVKRLFWMRLLLFFFLVIALIPLQRSLTDEFLARQQFPLLSSFETPSEMDRWKEKNQLNLEAEIVRDGQYSMRVHLTTETYSGAALVYFPHNWHGYTTLYVSVFNPDKDSVELVCRIHDDEHNNEYQDRFNKVFLLQPGWNDLQISLREVEQAPGGRDMDMTNIRNVGLFVVRQPKERILYVDSVFLK